MTILNCPRLKKNIFNHLSSIRSDWRHLPVLAVCCPPNYKPNEDGFKHLGFLENWFLTDWDYNANHTS